MPPPILTSEEQMNLFRLRDKMTLLNSDFIKVINGYVTEQAYYDFTATMQSYMDHAKNLRIMYKREPGTENVPAANGAAAPVAKKPENDVSHRKIAKAQRKNTPKAGEATPKAATNTSVFAASSPATTATVPKFGDISMIGKTTPAPIPKKVVAEDAAEAPAVPAPAAARKRAIRGGGPLGGSESVIFKGGHEGKSPSTSTTVIPPVTIKFPEPNKDFWTKKSDAPAAAAEGGSLFAFLGKDSSSNGAPKFSGFSFGKNQNNEESSGTTDNTVKVVKTSMFGNIVAATSPEKKTLSFGSTSSEPAGGAGAGAGAPKPFSFGTSLFGGSSTTSSDSTAPAAPKLTFGSSLATSTAPAPLGGSSIFSGFAGLAQKAMAGQNQEKEGGDDEEAEYVPPKAEAVENEEPDAILSSKVSVFKFTGKEYAKLGVGMLHIKCTAGKHSLLIRAATTTGTVWLNALCNKAMKATKVDEKGERIRLTCPASASEMATMMIRFGTADGAKKFTDKIDELTK